MKATELRIIMNTKELYVYLCYGKIHSIQNHQHNKW